jgi:hypothetical protein
VIGGTVGLAAVIAVGSRALLGGTGVVTGSALENPGGGAIVQPLPPDTPLAVGVVYIRNRSDEPIELVGARLLRVDPQVEPLGFGVLPMGPGPYGSNPPITWLEYPLPGQVALRDYPPIPPTQDNSDQAKVMFGLRVKPHGAGKAIGIEVTYRQDGKLRKQVFEDQVYVCWVPTKEDGDCPGVDESRYSNIFGDFEDEVKGANR